MNREVIAQKLESLRHCLQRIESKCPADAETLATDPDLQDIVALNLSRAVQVCVEMGARIIACMPQRIHQNHEPVPAHAAERRIP